MSDDWPDTTDGPCPTVMLWHDMPPDAAVSSHVDWLLAREPEGRSPLLTFRLERPLHELSAGAVANAQHIGDHRAAYLTYEGPVSGNHGSVHRVGQGLVEAVRRIGGGRVELDICWQSGSDLDVATTVEVTETAKAGKCLVKMLATSAVRRYK